MAGLVGSGFVVNMDDMDDYEDMDDAESIFENERLDKYVKDNKTINLVKAVGNFEEKVICIQGVGLITVSNQYGGYLKAIAKHVDVASDASFGSIIGEITGHGAIVECEGIGGVKDDGNNEIIYMIGTGFMAVTKEAARSINGISLADERGSIFIGLKSTLMLVEYPAWSTSYHQPDTRMPILAPTMGSPQDRRKELQLLGACGRS